MNRLDAVLSSWHEAHTAACRQVDRQRVLGFPPAALPNRPALMYATLAALGARGKLEDSIRPEVEALCAKGVLDPNASVSQLNVGVLAAIEAIRPHLRNVSNLVEAMSGRALVSATVRTHDNAPILRVPKALRAAAGQTVRIEIQCAAADRLLIHASGLGMTRVIIQPAPIQMLSLTMYAGDLIVYAENDAGCSKLVRPMDIGTPVQRAAVDRRFARTALGRSGGHGAEVASQGVNRHEGGST
jgi:hypothetical protein